MNSHLTQTLALEHQRDLEAQAGCCTPIAEHRRALRRSFRERLVDRPISGATQPTVCCA